MIEAVLFDLDGTLWDRDQAFRNLVEAQHGVFPELASLPRGFYVDRAVQLDNYGTSDTGAVYAQIVSECGLAPELADALLTHFWTSFQSFLTPFPEVPATLRWLRDQGLKLGIITNGDAAIQQTKITGLGLADLVDIVVISEREGVRKPDAAIFERALRRLGVAPHAAWFVGDHPDADMRGASEAGLTAVWRRSWSEASHATHEIASLEELIPLVAAAMTAEDH